MKLLSLAVGALIAHPSRALPTAPIARERGAQEVAPPAETPSGAERVVAAYWPEYRWGASVEVAVASLTDLILFSVTPLPTGAVDDHWISVANFARARAAADAVPGRVVNVLLCVGGGGRSAGFAKASASKASRKRLVGSLVALVDKHGLDGLDFDWEQPRGEEEVANYALLLKAAAKALRPRGKLVTVAVHPFPDDASVLDFAQAFAAVDRVHLMAYDFAAHEPGATHASLPASQRAVNRLLASGAVPAAKIVLGIPAYGRHLAQPHVVKTYAELVDELEKAPRSPSEVASHARATSLAAHALARDAGLAADAEVPNRRSPGAEAALSAVEEASLSGAPSDTDKGGFGLNGVLTVGAKVLAARRSGLAGVFFWEAGQDKLGHRHSLLAWAAVFSEVTGSAGGGGVPGAAAAKSEL